MKNTNCTQICTKIWLNVTDWMPQILLVGPLFKIRLKKCYAFSSKCESSLIVSDSAHISFSTVKCMHATLGKKRKTHFWLRDTSILEKRRRGSSVDKKRQMGIIDSPQISQIYHLWFMKPWQILTDAAWKYNLYLDGLVLLY